MKHSSFLSCHDLRNTHSCNNLRDATWTNLCARTLKKVDKAMRTGSSTQEFDEVDNLMLQFLGESSQVVVGLKVAEAITILSSHGTH